MEELWRDYDVRPCESQMLQCARRSERRRDHNGQLYDSQMLQCSRISEGKGDYDTLPCESPMSQCARCWVIGGKEGLLIMMHNLGHQHSIHLALSTTTQGL